jgi:predicted ArsR family transcriptional regulator
MHASRLRVQRYLAGRKTPATVAEIAAVVNLYPSTVRDALRDLDARRTPGLSNGRRGRPAARWSLP